MDPRIKTLAKNLLTHSLSLQEGEHLLIDVTGFDTAPLAEALICECHKLGAHPHFTLNDSRIRRALLKSATEDQLAFDAKWALNQMLDIDAYVAVRGSDNASEYVDIPKETLQMQAKIMSPVLRERVDRTRWVVLRYPNPSMAQLANMSTEAFEDFYFNVCNLNYAKMSTAMDALVDIMNKTDKVRLTAPGTDITFSIKDIPAIKCAGECNIPDGEVYTAPVRNSINGTITYNTPSQYQGTTFEQISFTFENGKIINATSNDTPALNHILDTDEGARYVGEFAIGVNPYILSPFKDTLFDEKISGSIHFTPGCCYEDAPNGNKSDIHWDLVLIMRPEWGGGDIYFDDVLIRRDGLFVPKELTCLNPDALLGKE